jgi:hypothetical protein
MSAAVGALMIIAGVLLIGAADPKLAGIDTMVAGLILLMLGGIAMLLVLMLWCADPASRERDERHARGD